MRFEVMRELRPGPWEVTELTPERSFTWVSSSGGVRTVGGHRIVVLPERRVGVELTLDQSGPLAPVVGRLAGGVIRRYL